MKIHKLSEKEIASLKVPIQKYEENPAKDNLR
jgi:hypothetical protein